MGKLKSRAWALIIDESGQTTTEYVLLLAVVVFIVMKVKTTMEGSLQRLVGSAFQKAETELQQGN